MSRFLQATTLTLFVTSAVISAFGSPVVENGLVARQAPDNVVSIGDTATFW